MAKGAVPDDGDAENEWGLAGTVKATHTDSGWRMIMKMNTRGGDGEVH